jgi:hypothetical protein
MIGFNGGLIGKDRTTTVLAAVGVWTPGEQIKARRANVWPVLVEVDPDFSSVSLLLHGDSTPITDSSNNTKTITVAGNVALDTGVKKFGASSIYFDGIDANRCQTNSSLDFAFGTSNYTVEGWFYFITVGSNMRVWQFSAGGDNLDLASSDRIAYFNGTGQTFSGNNAVTASVWHHIALVRNSGTATVYIDGVSVLSTASTPNTTSTRDIGVGGQQNANLNGYVDDFRITKGVARYTSNFTPPILPFPDQ